MSTRLTEEQKVVHFLNRTSFGPTREDVRKSTGWESAATWKSSSVLKNFRLSSERNSPVSKNHAAPAAAS
jgi:hypothetical protein